MEAGLGATLLPDTLVQDRPRLVPLAFSRRAAAALPPFPEGVLWLAAHRAMRSIPRVAAVWDFIVEQARDAGASELHGVRGLHARSRGGAAPVGRKRTRAVRPGD